MTLRDLLMIHVDEGTLTPLAAQFILDEHDRRVTELIEANNRYLERARAAEGELARLYGVTQIVIDPLTTSAEHAS